MSYYVDLDTRSSTFYIAPMAQNKASPWVIRFKARHEADNFLRKLVAGLVKDPMADQNAYELAEIYSDPALGDLSIFVLKTY